MMQHNALNYIAAVCFFIAAWKDLSAIWLVMGCVCVQTGVTRSRQNQRK